MALYIDDLNEGGLGFAWDTILASVVGGLATIGTAALTASLSKKMMEAQEKAQLRLAQEQTAAAQAAAQFAASQADAAKAMEKSFFEKYGLYIGLGVAAVGIPATILLLRN